MSTLSWSVLCPALVAIVTDTMKEEGLALLDTFPRCTVFWTCSRCKVVVVVETSSMTIGLLLHAQITEALQIRSACMRALPVLIHKSMRVIPNPFRKA